ncbi:MAG: hypothetical protein ACXU8U_06830, partial [Asticcacaulis sp.]
MNRPLAQPRMRLMQGAALMAVIAAGVFTVSAEASEGRYLSWQNKAGATVATQPQPQQNTVEFQGQAVPVPPSPYGQVGDPYGRVLSWGTKGRPVDAVPHVASAAPANRAPVQAAPVQVPTVQAPAQSYGQATAPVSDPAPAPR